MGSWFQPLISAVDQRAGLLVLLLALVLATTACEVAASETRRGPEPLRPIGDALAEGIAKVSFPWTATAGSPASIGEIVQTAGNASAAAVTLRISAGGTGVSLRSDCADGARAGGAWTDNTSVDVVEYGSGRCASWTRATTGSTTSWVRDEYLQGLPPPDQRTTPGVSSTTPGDPALAQLRKWSTQLLDGAGRVALLSRHAPDSTERGFTLASLGRLQEDMRALAAEITSAEAAPSAACTAPRRATIEGVNAVAELAKQMHDAFAAGGTGTAGLETLVERYLAAQQESARLITTCARR